MKRLLLCAIIFVSWCGGSISAQMADAEVGKISYVNGDDFALQNAMGYRSYKVSSEAVIGLKVVQGDLLMTGRGTSVEVRFEPSGTILKIAENTTLRLSNMSQKTTEIELVYGRIRAKVATVLGRDSFRIRGQSTVAGVRGTDLGYDVLVQPEISSKPTSSVFCFEGSVAVSNIDNLSEPSVILSDRQSVVSLDPSNTKAMERLGGKRFEDGTLVFLVGDSIPEIISDFWQLSPFNKDPGTGLAQNEPNTVPEPKDSQNPTKTIEPTTPSTDPQVIASKEPDMGNQADQLAPLNTLSAMNLMPKQQFVYTNDDLKTAGIITVASGLVITVIGAVIGTYGSEFFQIAKSDSASIGSAGLIGGVSITAIGSFLYIWGMIDH